ncbi:MAG: PH domain-containing protein [Gemmatimonadaceae bacterium]
MGHPDTEDMRRLHPLTCLFSALQVARRFVIPAIIGGFSAGDEYSEVLRWILIIMAVPAFVAAAAKYATYRYALGDDELVITSGVLGRKHRVIPLTRVQNVELRQNLLHTFTGVVELRVETAGGGGGETEGVLSVIDRDVAEELRTRMLSGRHTATEPAEIAAQHMPAPEQVAPRAEQLAHLTPRDLAIAGATANEIGFIAAVLAGASQFADDLPMRFTGPLRELGDRFETATASGVFLWGSAIVLLLLFFGWLFSIIGSMIGYHGFTIELAGSELRKRYGFFNRRETNIPLGRVQAVRVEESALRRPFGLAALKVETAGGGPGQNQRGGAEAFVPIAPRDEVPGLVARVLDGADIACPRLNPVHPASRRRGIVRNCALVLLLMVALWLPFGSSAVAVLLLAPVGVAAAFAQYRSRGWARIPGATELDGVVVVRAGVWGRTTWVIPERRIQTLHVTQGPLQRVHGLATLAIDTAAGGRVARIADLARGDALDLMDALGP